MFQQFPDDNKNEDFLNEFRQKIAEQSNLSFEERKNELNRSKSVFVGAVSGVILAGIVGWFVLSPRYAQDNNAEIPVIRRPQTAIKVQPAEPGGMEILNQDKSVYGILDKSENKTKNVENLLPPPEEPKLPVIVAEEVKAPAIVSVEDIIEQQETSNSVVVEAERIIETANTTAAKENKAEEKTISIAEAATQVKTPSRPEIKIEEPKAPEVKKEEKKEAVSIASSIPNGVWQVQLMSSNVKSSIEKSWDALTKKYKLLEKQPHEVEEADLGAKGIYYRLKAGAFKDKVDADRLCNDIKALGGTCIVKKK